MQTYLNSLVFERFVRIVYVLECNAVELAFVDIGDTVILTPLGAAARCFQVVFEAIGGKPGPQKEYPVKQLNLTQLSQFVDDTSIPT